MNNLCVWGMSQFLSYGRFKWLKSVDNFDVNSVSENSPIGYILDVDLEYLEKLDKSHNDLRRDSHRLDSSKRFSQKKEILTKRRYFHR